MDTGPVTVEPWLAAGIFRPLLHRVDLDTAPWRFGDWDGIWFAACRCPVTRLWGDTAAASSPPPPSASPDQGPSDG